MGSKPSTQRSKLVHSPSQEPAQRRQSRNHSHDDRHGHGHSEDHHHCSDGPPNARNSPELKALFKHIAFRAAASKKLDLVSCVQEVMMQELGIAEPDLADLERVLQRECEDMTVITEEEIERVCAAFPNAAARLAENGSPFALFFNQIPSHLALARALEQVVQSKAPAGLTTFAGLDHLLAQKVGKWHGQLEVGEHPSSSLGMFANLDKEVSPFCRLLHLSFMRLVRPFPADLVPQIE